MRGLWHLEFGDFIPRHISSRNNRSKRNTSPTRHLLGQNRLRLPTCLLFWILHQPPTDNESSSKLWSSSYISFSVQVIIDRFPEISQWPCTHGLSSASQDGRSNSCAVSYTASTVVKVLVISGGDILSTFEERCHVVELSHVRLTEIKVVLCLARGKLYFLAARPDVQDQRRKLVGERGSQSFPSLKRCVRRVWDDARVYPQCPCSNGWIQSSASYLWARECGPSALPDDRGQVRLREDEPKSGESGSLNREPPRWVKSADPTVATLTAGRGGFAPVDVLLSLAEQRARVTVRIEGPSKLSS